VKTHINSLSFFNPLFTGCHKLRFTLLINSNSRNSTSLAKPKKRIFSERLCVMDFDVSQNHFFL